MSQTNQNIPSFSINNFAEKMKRNKFDLGIPEFAKPNPQASLSAGHLTLQRDTEYLISQILAIAPSMPKGISKVLQAMGENFGWEVGIFFKIDPLQNKICCDQVWGAHLTKCSEFLESSKKGVFSPGVELPGLVWQSRKPCWITALANVSKSLRATEAVISGFKSALVFPICLGEKILGVIELFSYKTHDFDKDLLQTVDAIGNQVGQFMERKETEKRLQLAYEEMEVRVEVRTIQLMESNLNLQAEIAERKKIEKEILEIPLQEQRRFGTELHDGLCQELTGILMLVTSLTQKMNKENSAEVDKLKTVEVLLLNAINQARDTARGLYPGELESASLIHSLEELTSRTQSQSEVICEFYCPKLIEINDAMATHLYRIAQEGITNAVKHGKARNIEVSFIEHEGKITFMVKDNGQGITAHPDSECGIGLNIMKYRAHLMDATFHVESNVPHGVILKFCFKNIISQERDL